MNENVLHGAAELLPGVPMPGFSDHETYRQHLVTHLQLETPHQFGLHPNAEIGILTSAADELFRSILELEPVDLQGPTAVAALDVDTQVRLGSKLRSSRSVYPRAAN